VGGTPTPVSDGAERRNAALRDAFRKLRHFVMTTQGLSEDEAISPISVGADFGITQGVDGNWGVHGILKKALFGGVG
jgi:acetamidase/formamidase